VENRGVGPDLEVEFDPQAVREGHDPLLEKAVELVLAELHKNCNASSNPFVVT
jgi:tricorn protease